MRTAIAAIAAAALLGGCDAPPQGTVSDGGRGTADLIAVVDGCRVWRINGTWRPVFFAKCGDTAAATQWDEGCGKNCRRPVQTINGQ